MHNPETTSQQRATSIVMISVLSNQLNNWIKHSKDLGYAKMDYKNHLTKVENSVGGLLKHLQKVTTTQENEDFFELSAQYSDMVEKIISIDDENDLNEVMKVIELKFKRKTTDNV